MELTIDNSNKNILFESEIYSDIKVLTIQEIEISELNLNLFPNLVSLNVSNISLKKLDLSPCSNLTSLSCDSNRLTQLDLSPCSNLTALSCGDNQLKQLDLSPCSNLTKLFCDNNQLTQLDLSPCPNLTKLNCESNDLTDLDLSPCPNLNILLINDNPNLTHISNSLIFLNRLTIFEYSNCPLELTRLQLQFVNRLERRYSKRTIFEDSQNVHDSSIVKCIRDGLYNIFKNPEYKADKHCVEKMLQNEKLTISIKSILRNRFDVKNTKS